MFAGVRTLALMAVPERMGKEREKWRRPPEVGPPPSWGSVCMAPHLGSCKQKGRALCEGLGYMLLEARAFPRASLRSGTKWWRGTSGSDAETEVKNRNDISCRERNGFAYK